MSKPPKILVVEDDAALGETIAYNLRREGYAVQLARDGIEGLRLAKTESPRLIILDLMLPSIDGLEVCRQIRSDAKCGDVRVLMLTAKGEEADQIVGFSAGADDYVPKPFSVRVLLQRIKALLRRGRPGGEADEVVESQGVVVDRTRRRVQVQGALVELTPSEFELLYAMIRQPGRAFRRAELIDAALGDDAVVLERTIDVHIRALRKKLSDLGPYENLIETVRGVGYRFRDPIDAESDESVPPETAGSLA